MRKGLIILPVILILAACSSAPSKGVVKDIVRNNKNPDAEIRVTDLRCTEHDNEEYHCFVAWTEDHGDKGKADMKAEDAIFRKVNGDWESNLLSVGHYAFLAD